jgi:hypothetical protein
MAVDPRKPTLDPYLRKRAESAARALRAVKEMKPCGCGCGKGRECKKKS